MCGIIDKYIAQVFPDGEVYSDTLSREFVIKGADLIYDANHSRENARGIIVHSVFIQAFAGVTVHKLIDAQNNVLMNFQEQPNITGIYHFKHYINSGRIFLNLTLGGSGKVTATVQYQYLYDKPQKRIS